MRVRLSVLPLVILAALLPAACSLPKVSTTAPIAAPPVGATAPIDYGSLHNVVSYAPGLISGAAPEDDAAFNTLAAMGVKTIISVDGATPDVDAARQRSMRYVHLPIGYDGIDRVRTLELARAVRELPGPVYIHCHHGKHRSAAAAGATAVTLGLLERDQALQRMNVSGIAPNYTGLFACVNAATLAGAAELDTASNAFPERWQTTGLVNSMVEIDQAMEHLKAIEEAGWQPPVDHPDLVPAAQAGRLADLLGNLRDEEQVKAQPAELSDWLLQSSQAAQSLEAELAIGVSDPDHLSGRLQSVSQSCKTCHRKYRD